MFQFSYLIFLLRVYVKVKDMNIQTQIMKKRNRETDI